MLKKQKKYTQTQTISNIVDIDVSLDWVINLINFSTISNINSICIDYNVKPITQIIEHCSEKGVGVGVRVKNIKELDTLKKHNISFILIPDECADDVKLIRKACETTKTVIVDIKDLTDEDVNTIVYLMSGFEIEGVLLYDVNDSEIKIEDLDLQHISVLNNRHPKVSVGYKSVKQHIHLTPSTICLGAKYICFDFYEGEDSIRLSNVLATVKTIRDLETIINK
jgi:sialic acid synthase SpsE